MKLPERSKKYGVGKEIGGNIYVHKKYAHLVIPSSVIKSFKNKIPKSFKFTIIKFNYKKNQISFIECKNFDKRHEPEIGDVWVVSGAKVKKFSPPKDPWIYHHKWL